VRGLCRPSRLARVRLDRGFDRDEIAAIIEDAYAEVVPPRLLKTD
jgi:hypothetical protein